MSKRVFLGVVCLLFFGFSASAFPEADKKTEKTNSQIVIRSEKGTELNVSTSGLKADSVDFVVKSSLSQENLAAQSSNLAVNLWVLVDASALCQANHLDQYMAAQLIQLKKWLAPGSLLSVVSFTNSTLEVQHNHRPILEADAINLKCDAHLLSTSYEKALMRLMDGGRDSNLPTVVWVYTSGNIQLSDQVLNA